MSALKTELYPEAGARHSKSSEAYRKAKKAIVNEWISGLTGAFLAMVIVGMYDVEFTSPTENQVILDNQLARIIAGNLTIT